MRKSPLDIFDVKPEPPKPKYYIGRDASLVAILEDGEEIDLSEIGPVFTPRSTRNVPKPKMREIKE